MSANIGADLSSGKGAADENFPIGSWLLSPSIRPHIATFYRFARAADDIADHETLDAESKLRRLNLLAAALDGDPDASAAAPIAAAMRAAAAQTGVGLDHCRSLLSAFRQDAVTRRCGDWDDLLDYCRRSADPVGRYVLALHGCNDEAAAAAADALSTALQILNHLQDCRTDYLRLDRVYVPLDMLAATPNGVAALGAERSCRALRLVRERILDRVDLLLKRAAALPRLTGGFRLALEAGAILAAARLLAAALRRRDPLAERVKLSRFAMIAAGLQGAAKAAAIMTAAALKDAAATTATLLDAGRRRVRHEADRHPSPNRHTSPDRHTSRVVRRSGSSFRLAMRLLPRRRRLAIFAVYAFCREIDDIADSDAPVARRRADLAAYRRGVVTLYEGKDDEDKEAASAISPTFAALAPTIAQFSLPQSAFMALLDGMELDLDGAMVRPSKALLRHYCRCVAAATGILAVRVFGVAGADLPIADRYAETLGIAMQLTNIVRDPEEDLRRGRLYIPAETLESCGIAETSPERIAAHRRFPEALALLADEAEAHFAACDLLPPPRLRAAMRPAMIMADGYRLSLDRLKARGFERFREPVSLPSWRKWRILHRHLIRRTPRSSA